MSHMVATPALATIFILEATIYDYKRVVQNMICVNSFLLTESSTCE